MFASKLDLRVVMENQDIRGDGDEPPSLTKSVRARNECLHSIYIGYQAPMVDPCHGQFYNELSAAASLLIFPFQVSHQPSASMSLLEASYRMDSQRSDLGVISPSYRSRNIILSTSHNHPTSVLFIFKVDTEAYHDTRPGPTSSPQS